tara:strand:+ start:678 stop:1934 length:1257 start_codon:yes stop_codon:yes gene_type:complete
MAIDPRIAMGAQAPNLQSSLKLFQDTLNNIQGRKMNAQSMAQNEQMNPLRVQEAQQVVDSNDSTAATNRENQNIQSIANYAPTLRKFLDNGDNMGAAQSLTQRIDFLERNGRDPTESREALQAITNGNPDMVLQALDIAEREAVSRGLVGNASNMTAGQKEFQSLTEQAQSSDPFISQAARIRLGVDPRAGMSAQERIASDTGTTDAVAASQSKIQGSVEQTKQDIKAKAEGKTAAVKAAVSKAADAFDKVANIRSTMSNYDTAIAELDAGAATGTIYSAVPSLNSASKRLDNVIKNLGLNVIGSTTFGALSESELAFALRAAIPDNLPPRELRQWLVAKKASQEKLLQGIEAFVSFTGGGEKTLADWNNRESLLKFGGTPEDMQTEPEKPTLDINNVNVDELTEAEIDALLSQSEKN